MKTLLVTRPIDTARDFAEEVMKDGFSAIIEPLLEIETTETDIPDLSKYTALIFTSPRAIRIFSQLSNTRTHQIFTVGDQTASIAYEHGFKHVSSANGNIGNLVSLIKKEHLPSRPLLYIKGRNTAGDLSIPLKKSGFIIDPVLVYNARMTAKFSPSTLDLLKEQKIDFVSLFSVRTAKNFATLVRKYGLEDHCTSMVAVCLSAHIAEEIKDFSFAKIVTTQHPSRAAILELLRDNLRDDQT